MYDFGSSESNQQHYGQVCDIVIIVTSSSTCMYQQDTPPLYDLSKFSVPTYLFTGGQDWLADPTDVAKLIPQIQHVLRNHTAIPSYDHFDFIWGIDANKRIYNVIINNIKAVSLCSYIHSPFCLILQPNLPQCLSCCLPYFGWT